MVRIRRAVEVHDAPPAVPHPHAVVEVAGGEAVEVEHGPALESHPHVAAARLDARDVAEARHEGPAEVDLALPVGDLDPEDLDRAALLGQPLGRHVGDPGVLVLEAVEVVAPERLLVAPPAQPPLVGGAVIGGDAAVEEALVGLRRRRRGRGGDRGRGRRGGVDLLLEGPVADDEGARRTSTVANAPPAIVALVMVGSPASESRRNVTLHHKVMTAQCLIW